MWSLSLTVAEDNLSCFCYAVESVESVVVLEKHV